MPDHAALIAVLIIERPLCFDCIAAKSGMSVMSVKVYLETMEKMATVHHASEARCRACGIIGKVSSLPRRK